MASLNRFLLSRISRVGDEKGDYPIQQIDYLGKEANAAMWFPFGFHANVDVDSVGIMFALGEKGESKIVLPSSGPKRPKLEAGELVMYHPKTQSRIHFKADGAIEVTSDTSLKFDVPSAQFTGDVTVDGGLNVTGASALSAMVTSAGKDISNTHTHIGSPSAPTGAVTPTGIPV